MKKKNLIHYKTFVFLISLLLALAPNNAFAQKKDKKKKKDAQEQTVPKPKKDDKKSIEDLTKGSAKMEGLFTIYQDTVSGSIQMVIKDDQIGKEFIYFSQIADGVMDAGRINRGSYRGSKVIKINKYFDRLEFEEINTSYYFDPENPISKAKNANISNAIIESLKIEAYDDKNGLYLVKSDDLFKKETFIQVKPARFPNQPPTAFSLGNLDKDKTKIKEIKNYPENTNILTEYVYSQPSVLNRGSSAVTDARNVSIQLYQTFLAMPEDDYEMRYEDPRVGYFTQQVEDQTSTSATPYKDMINRWRLVKKDPDASISEPVKPITWWIENTTPHEWRETIKNAVLQWNKAFEKAGFKNAIVVEVQPDTATWDAGDVRYNVLRWTSSPQPPFGGYGPSFANPRTGELLGADIMLEYNIFTGGNNITKIYGNSAELEFNPYFIDEELDTNNYCMLGQAMKANYNFAIAAAKTYAESNYVLNKIQKDLLTGVVIHEIGHTLGLEHNMKASQLFTPEQLADASFIEGKCLTASIMDYAIPNVTRDRSKQGQYDDVTVGPYDIWAIQFGYKPFKSNDEMIALLNESTKPEHIYGNDADDMRSPGRAIDPRVMVFDQSSDAIRYAIDRIELCNDLMKSAKVKFSKNGESYQELRNVYYTLSGQKANSGNVISRYIGGVYVDRAMVGQEGGTQPYTPVSLEDQKRAMVALSKYVFAPNAFEAPADLYNYLARQRRGFDYSNEDPKIHDQVLRYQINVLNHLLHPNTLKRITDSQLYGNQYSLSSMMNDLTDAIFKADIFGNVNSFRQNLQLEYTNRLIGMLVGNSDDRYDNNSKSMAIYTLNKIKTMAAPSGDVSSRAHKLHLKTLIDNAMKEVK